MNVSNATIANINNTNYELANILTIIAYLIITIFSIVICGILCVFYISNSHILCRILYTCYNCACCDGTEEEKKTKITLDLPNNKIMNVV
jgi:hypothetical protein